MQEVTCVGAQLVCDALNTRPPRIILQPHTITSVYVIWLQTVPSVRYPQQLCGPLNFKLEKYADWLKCKLRNRL